MFLFVLFTLLSVAHSDSSFLRQFPTDVEITPTIYDIGNCPTSLSQSGYFISVWSLQLKDIANFGIMGQIYDGKGNTYGEKFKMSTSWQGPDSFDNGIYAKIFNYFGVEFGTEFLVNQKEANDQTHPSVASVMMIHSGDIYNVVYCAMAQILTILMGYMRVKFLYQILMGIILLTIKTNL